MTLSLISLVISLAAIALCAHTLRNLTRARSAGLEEHLEHLKILEVKPQDVVVVKAADLLSTEQLVRIRAHIGDLLGPEQKVLVLDDRLDLSVVRSPDLEEAARGSNDPPPDSDDTFKKGVPPLVNECPHCGWILGFSP